MPDDPRPPRAPESEASSPEASASPHPTGPTTLEGKLVKALFLQMVLDVKGLGPSPRAPAGPEKPAG